MLRALLPSCIVMVPRRSTSRPPARARVKAGDIHADGEVEILNPDLHIATLMSDARLSMEITMTSGRGYVPAEKNKQHQTSIGVIPVDSIYTPVYKGKLTVENTRVRDPDRL